MTRALLLGLRLSWGSAKAQRVRAVSVALATAIGVVVLLLLAGIAHSELVQHPEEFNNPGATGKRLLLAVVVAIVLPVLVLATSVARLSADLRDRRMANLRLLGMSRGRVRVVAAVEVGVTSLIGSLVGAIAFIPLRLPVSGVTVAGRQWPASTLWPTAWAWVAVIVGLPLVVMVVSAMPARMRMRDTLARAHRADGRRPGWWRVVPLIVGVACCVYVLRADPTRSLGDSVIVALFVGCGLLALGTILVVPIFVRLLADLVLRVSSRPTLRVAARRMQAQPAAVNRVISGLLIGVFAVIGARAVVTAFQSVNQYTSAAYQVEHQQRVSGMVLAKHFQSKVARAQRIPGVDRVYALPAFEAPCGPETGDAGCFSGIAATCAQVRALAPGLRGCVPGKPLVLSDFAVDHDTGTVPDLTPSDSRGRSHKALAVHVSKDWVRPTTPDDSAREAAWQLEALGVEVVLPPAAPGVAAASKVADRQVVVTAPPGRWLADRVYEANVFVGYSEIDFGFYDMVRALRVMVYAIASVIICVGLLAFAVTALDRAVTRRREVTALQLIGVPRGMLRTSQWLEAAAPLGLGTILASGLGVLAGATYLSLDSGHLAVPWRDSTVIALFAVAGAAVVGGLTVFAANPRISPDLIRRE